MFLHVNACVRDWMCVHISLCAYSFPPTEHGVILVSPQHPNKTAAVATRHGWFDKLLFTTAIKPDEHSGESGETEQRKPVASARASLAMIMNEAGS